MPPRNTQLALYMAKVETTDGTDPVPVPTVNAIELIDHFDPDYDNVFKNDALTRVRGPVLEPGDPMSNAGPAMSTARKAALRGVSALPSAAAPIELDAWFRSAGYAATYDATGGAENVIYTPAQTNMESMAEYYYRDGILYKHLAVRSELGVNFDVGGAIMVDLKPEGRVSSDADAAVPTTGVFKTTPWPIATDAPVFTIDGVTTAIIRKWSHNAGNVLQRRDGVKSAGGIAGWWIPVKNPTWSCVLEESTRTVHDWMLLRNNNTPIAITWTIGATLYNTIVFASARAFIRKVTPSNANGLALITLEGFMRGAVTHTLQIK